MMSIPIAEMFASLEQGYIEFKTSKETGSNPADLAHIQGFCTVIEQILNVYGGVTAEEIKKIKIPIIGNVPMMRKIIDMEEDLDKPTIFRRSK